MRSKNQVESDIESVKTDIRDAQSLDEISKLSGVELLMDLFERTRLFYAESMQNLDENSPVFRDEYGKRKACRVLVEKFIFGIKNSNKQVGLLKQKFLDLNEELGKVMEELELREKNRM